MTDIEFQWFRIASSIHGKYHLPENINYFNFLNFNFEF